MNNIQNRDKFVYVTNYGVTADIFMLPIGTQFEVINGAWMGFIKQVDGNKCLCIGNNSEPKIIDEHKDYGLVIRIISVTPQRTLNTNVISQEMTDEFNELMAKQNSKLRIKKEDRPQYNHVVGTIYTKEPLDKYVKDFPINITEQFVIELYTFFANKNIAIHVERSRSKFYRK